MKISARNKAVVEASLYMCGLAALTHFVYNVVEQVIFGADCNTLAGTILHVVSASCN